MICENCLESLPRENLKCLKCGRKNPLGTYCVDCRGKLRPDRVLAVYKFDGPIRELIHEFKYEDVTALAEPLGKAMAGVLEMRNGKWGVGREWVVLPLPLSNARRRYRGYNQSELLAKIFASKTGLIYADILERKKIKGRRSQVQSGDKITRKNNVKGVFALKKDVQVPEKVILIDDVVTTGATVEEATKVLKRAGAKEVIVLGLAMG